MSSLVSIIIPTKNSATTLPRCLEAIHQQTYQSIEVIIVDTKSTDDTLSISQSMSCKVVSTGWKLLGARYEGFKVSVGDFVLMLDSDQILEKSTIEKCVNLAKEYDMLFLEEMTYEPKNLLQKMYQADRRLIQNKEFEVQKDPFYGAISARFFRRDIFEKAFALIPKQILPFVVAHEDAIIYYEAWKISTSVSMVPNALWHIESESIIEIWKKYLSYGRSTKQLLKEGYYKDLVRNRDRFRKSRSIMSRDKILSMLLLSLKGPPYFIGLYF